MTTWEELKKEAPETYIDIVYEIDGVKEWCWREGDVGGFQYPAQEWEVIRDTILKHTKGRDVIVQAGGCCGMYPRLWSKYFETVHTFEPVDANFHALCENCPGGHIHKHHAALGEVQGFVRMQGGLEGRPNDYERRKNVGMYWVQGMYDSGVYQMKLDDLKLPKVDVIQLDVEEYEFRVLKGAVETIKRCKPTLCIESYSNLTQELMIHLGYDVVDRAARDFILTPRI